MSAERPRVLAICLCRNGDRILCFEGNDPVKGEVFYRPLGGTVEFGETGVQAVVRELREELGAELTDVRHVATIENLFTYRGRPGHEVVLVYDGTLTDRRLYERDDLECVEETVTWPARWMHLDSFLEPGAPPLHPDGLLDLLLGR